MNLALLLGFLLAAPSDLLLGGRLTQGTTWDDTPAPALSTRSTGGTAPSFANFRDTLYLDSFSASATNTVFFTIQLPHSYDPGTSLHLHVHWNTGNSTNTGNVLWRENCAWCEIDAACGATATQDILQAGSGTAYAHQLAEFATPLSGTGHHQSSILVCDVSRVGGDGSDTFSAVSWLMSVDVHYEKKTLGSPTEDPL